MEYDIQIQDVIDDMGTEIYAAYPEDERHEAQESIIVAFILMLFEEFIKGFFDFEALGKKTRVMFNSLFNFTGSKGNISQKKAAREIGEAVTALLADGAKPNPDAETKAVDQMTSFLISKGIPDKTARKRAQKVASTIKRQLNL